MVHFLYGQGPHSDSAIIQQIILNRWNPLRLNKKIASHFGLTINQVRHIRSKSAF
jgi:hypothetical protein